jgi:calcineurin-like phosphoesterase family protein
VIYFTADPHINHLNVISYCKRPFSDVNKMNAALEANWNKKVKAEDTVYVLGDFCLEREADKIYRITRRLNGTKILILGNHDQAKPLRMVEEGAFQSVHTSLQIEEFLCFHDPAWAVAFPNKPCLVGHVHQLFKFCDNGRVLNVGTDVWEYSPVSIDEVRQAFKLEKSRLEQTPITSCKGW